MFNTIAKPFGWLLLNLYKLTGSYGVSLILFACIIRIILMPFTIKTKNSSMRMQIVQPRIKALEKRYGTNSPKYAEEVRRIYKEENIKPTAGCLFALIQFPIIFALYYAIRYPLTIMMGVPASLLAEGGAIATKLAGMGFSTTVSSAYTQLAQAEFISQHFDVFSPLSDKLVNLNFNFLGLNLGNVPDIRFWTFFSAENTAVLFGLFLIPVLAGVVTFIQTQITMKTNNFANMDSGPDMAKSMMATMPLITVVICFGMPAAVGIYWISQSIFTAIQEYVVARIYVANFIKQNADKIEAEKQRIAEIQKKKAETEEKRKLGATTQNANTSKKKLQNQERLEREAKQAQWEKENGIDPEHPGRVGDRPNARGRAYSADRYGGSNEKAEDNIADNADDNSGEE